MAIALYARKSVERENSVSIDTQLEYCRAMLHPDEKGEDILIFADNGFSGGNVNRDGFQQMMAGIGRGEIHKLIVYRLDRISRSLSDFVGILETLKKHGVTFVSSQESFDSGSPYGEMIVKLLMVFAEFERQSIIARVTQAYEHRSSLGLFMGGKAPYGFTLTDAVICGIRTKTLAPAESIGQVTYIFERYAVSGVTLRQLMKELVREQMLPVGGNWSTAKLSAILRNPIYVRADNSIYRYFAEKDVQIVSEIGEFDGIHGIQMYGQSKNGKDSAGKKIVVMQHEGVVPSEVWLRCQSKLENNRQFGKAMSNSTSWLGGMLVCGECGRTMTVTKGGKRADGSYRRYFCCTGKSVGNCSGTDVTLYAESLEHLVQSLIGEKLADMKDCSLMRTDSDMARMNPLKNRLTEIQVAEAKLVELTLSGTLDTAMMDLLNDKARNLSEEKRRITAQMQELESRDARVICAAELTGSWEGAAYDVRKAVCRLLIYRIHIRRDGTVEVVWNL